MAKKIIITGSYNASIFLKGERIPQIGETCTGDTYFISAGGKGSNQAIAAKFQGADITYIGKLGKDTYGKDAIHMYEKLDLNKSIYYDSTRHTGVAVIFIDRGGNNSIMVAPGANMQLTADEIVNVIQEQEDVLMAGFQLENDVGQICEAIERLHAMGVQTLLDPAPAVPLPEEVYKSITIIKPNEHEAALLSQIPIENSKDALKAGRWFIDKGVETALITLGEMGCVLVSQKEELFIPAPAVKAVDTTGAGDIFSGSFLAALSKGYTYSDAARYASCGAALSVTKMGVLEAMPGEKETYDLLKKEYGI